VATGLRGASEFVCSTTCYQCD